MLKNRNLTPSTPDSTNFSQIKVCPIVSNLLQYYSKWPKQLYTRLLNTHPLQTSCRKILECPSLCNLLQSYSNNLTQGYPVHSTSATGKISLSNLHPSNRQSRGKRRFNYRRMDTGDAQATAYKSLSLLLFMAQL